MSQEAMRLALEALEDLQKYGVKQSMALCAMREALAEQQAAEPKTVLVEGFERVAMRKLNDLRQKGYAVNGVAIATTSPDGKTKHGVVTVHGKVLWWNCGTD